MEESILNSVKKMLGLEPNYDAFDLDIIMLINSALMTLAQIGVGPKAGYKITSSEETWSAILPDDRLVEAVKTYVYYRVRIMFDPPANSFVLDAIKEEMREAEWRIVHQMEEDMSDG